MVSQITELSVSVGTITTRVLKVGQGDPLVYLHGAFGYDGFPAFLDALARRFTVYAPLHPGFDESDGIDQIDDLLDLTLYHFDLLEALELENPHVVGHFFGAMMAAEMAAICPHRVNKLVIASPAGWWRDDIQGEDYFVTPLGEWRSILFNDPDSTIAKSVVPEPTTEEETGDMHIARVRSLSTVGKFLWPIPDKGLRKRLPRIKAETLVIVGDNDKIVPPIYGNEISALIPNARVETVKDGGHMFIIEQANAFVNLVTDFLSA